MTHNSSRSYVYSVDNDGSRTGAITGIGDINITPAVNGADLGDALYPLTLYHTLTVSEVITSQIVKVNRTFQVIGENNTLLYRIDFSIDDNGGDKCRCVYNLKDNNGEVLASLKTKTGFLQLQCCCTSCKHFGQKEGRVIPRQSASIFVSSEGAVAHIVLLHDLIAVYDPAMIVVLCSVSAKYTGRNRSHKVCVPQQRKRIPIATIEEDNASDGSIFSITPGDNPSARDMLFFLFLGLSLFTIDRSDPCPEKIEGACKREVLPSKRQPFAEDGCERFVRCCCCDTRTEPHGCCYVCCECCCRVMCHVS